MSNASFVINGFNFQAYSAVFLLMKYLKEVQFIRNEGEDEDIELYLENDVKILAQAKSSQNPYKDKNRNAKFIKALNQLEMSYLNNKEYNLRVEYISNIYDCLNDSFAPLINPPGPVVYNYRNLLDETKKLIDESSPNIDKESLYIRFLPYFGDDFETKNVYVLKLIEEFLIKIKTKTRLAVNKADVLAIWLQIISENGANKHTAKKISKSSLMWTILAVIIEQKSKNFEEEDFDEATVDEVLDAYEDFINKQVSKFDLCTKIISDYYHFERACPYTDSCEIIKEFKNSFRSTYKEIQLVNLETSEKKLINRVVSDYIIDSILNTRMYIQRIKKEANL
jgi:hypothetical protein